MRFQHHPQQPQTPRCGVKRETGTYGKIGRSLRKHQPRFWSGERPSGPLFDLDERHQRLPLVSSKKRSKPDRLKTGEARDRLLAESGSRPEACGRRRRAARQEKKKRKGKISKRNSFLVLTGRQSSSLTFRHAHERGRKKSGYSWSTAIRGRVLRSVPARRTEGEENTPFSSHRRDPSYIEKRKHTFGMCHYTSTTRALSLFFGKKGKREKKGTS